MQFLLICETLTFKGAVATGAARALASRSDCPTFQVRALLPSMFKDGFFACKFMALGFVGVLENRPRWFRGGSDGGLRPIRRMESWHGRFLAASGSELAR